jgi:hypothetical protein
MTIQGNIEHDDWNIDQAAHAIAAMTRSTIRGATSMGGWSSAQDALRHFKDAFEPLGQLDREKWLKVFLRASDLLQVSNGCGFDDPWQKVADRGARCFVEMSAHNGYARARESKAMDGLVAAVRDVAPR